MPNGKKNRRNNYEHTGTPEIGNGQRIVPVEELFGMMNDPKFRDAVDVIEKEEGEVRGLTVAVVKQFKRDLRSQRHIAAQKRAIDLQVAKQKGILER